MKTLMLLLCAACGLASVAQAQTAPRPAPPATMSAPSVDRSSMPQAAAGTGTVVTDRTKSRRERMRDEQMRDGQPVMKTKKVKSTMDDGTGKMKTKM